ncbi:MAG: hypothetical protein M1828_002449 [Chrysothrix sp. TS-e1954]|nr:MAG: hypothetical protein M1828_002449 [Chrysothrix sp. TS-e1954]
MSTVRPLQYHYEDTRNPPDSPDSNMQDEASSDWDASDVEDETETVPDGPTTATRRTVVSKTDETPQRQSSSHYPSHEISASNQLAGLSLDSDTTQRPPRRKFSNTNPFLKQQVGGEQPSATSFGRTLPREPLPPQSTPELAQGSVGIPYPTKPIAAEPPASPPVSQPPLIPVETDLLDGSSSSRELGHKQSDKRRKSLQGTSPTPTRRPQSSIPSEKALPPTPSVPQPQNQQSLNQPAIVQPTQQANEVYHIKHIRWYDAKAKKNPRESPILLQNANGPCPLLALVNALVLSTPPGMSTALIQTLHTREQVSLGLLLDAVFDELMSGRRGDSAQTLPDVSELYTFLVTLHTGMNVNPQFVPSKPEDHPKQRQGMVSGVGGFEDTKEMRMYSTFALPLIHGWTPEQHDEAHAAFEQSAPTYEEAQNILFREEELEQKFVDQTATPEEHQLYQDLTAIQGFLHRWPTQLTDDGLSNMVTFLKPSEVGVLFRNDHFSMVMKEPKSGKLMTLVTDAGYSTHDEIVWESLEDVMGAQSEMFSGDFRSVSHTTNSQDAADVGEWKTVKARHGLKRNDWNSEKPPLPSPSVQATKSLDTVTTQRTASEQEDHDLALALQLQEEEEERHRNERAVAARQRESQASERYLSQESSRRGPTIPERRRTAQSSPAPPPADSMNMDGGVMDGALPTYEEAARAPRFHPPRSHPSNENAPRQQQRQSRQASQGAPSAQAPRLQHTYPQQQIPVMVTPQRRTARQSLVERAGYPTPFDAGSRGTNDRASYDAIADRREGCIMM